jgi:molecular chaperone DnaK
MKSQSHPVGIDLGTTYCAVAYLDGDGRPQTIPNADGQLTTPSVVFWDNGHPIVGQQALDEAALEPNSIARFVKREMGQAAFSKTINGRIFAPEQIQAWILGKLKQDAEMKIGPIEDVVITVPAYFQEPKRHATVEAAKLAGFREIQIINEPTAAAIAFGVQQKLLNQRGVIRPKECVLVYDLGGGTFDVTVMIIDGENYNVLATDGEVLLGGVDWDRKIADMLANEFLATHGVDLRNDPAGEQRLLKAAESAKKSLSERENVKVILEHQSQSIRTLISRTDFESMSEGLLERTRGNVIDVLHQASLQWGDISRILLVGGSTRMPMVGRMLEAESGKKVDRSLSPDEAVAHGAAIYAGILAAQRNQTTGPHALTIADVNSHDLGVLARNRETGRLERKILIPRNTKLPTAARSLFRLAENGQRRVSARVIEGGDDSGNNATHIGACEVNDLPKGLPASTKVIVEFAYESDGRLKVSTSLPEHEIHATVEINRGLNANPSCSGVTEPTPAPTKNEAGPCDLIFAEATRAFDRQDYESAIQTAGEIFSHESATQQQRLQCLKLMGDAYLAADHLENAIGAYQEALKIDSNHGNILSSLAKAHFLNGNQGEARTFAGRCLAIEPNDPTCTRLFEEIG